MRSIIIILFLPLLLSSCNHSPVNPVDKQPQNIFSPDSLWTPTGNAQLDSLLQLAAVTQQDTNLVLLYDQIGDIYKNIDFEKAKEYYLKMEALSEQLDWSKGRYWSAGAFSNILQRERLIDSAVVVLQKALELAKRENNELQIAIMLSNIGSSYFFRGWYQMALSYYMEALPVYERMNRTNSLQTTYYYLSQLYNNIHEMGKAIEYGEKSVALNNENIYALSALAKAYSSAYEFEKANSSFEEALRLSTSQNNSYMTGTIYYFLADNAMKVFDLVKAEKYALQSLEIARQLSRASWGTNFSQLSKIEMLKGNYGKAEAYAKEALEIAIEHEMLSIKRYCYVLLAELAVAQGSYRDNIQYWNEWNLVENEIAGETVINAAEEMAAKYEAEKKTLEIESQQQIINRQNMQRGLLAGGIAVCLVFVALLWYLLRLRNRRNHALAEMNATKDKFFTIVSHDLKNPAVTVRDALNVLMNNIHLWDTVTLSAYCKELLNASEGHVELLYSLLNWAQVQTGRMTYTPQLFDLSARLRTDTIQARNMAEKKEINFTLTIPDDMLITGDANMISTVIRNLLTNAVKFTATGGSVTLSVEPTGTGSYLITVSDTGIGMSHIQVETGRAPSLQNTQSRQGTAGEQGSGLGLIVCRELLAKHGTTLHIESEEGKGSKMSFEIRC